MPDLIITDALVERCAQAADDDRSDRYGLGRRPLADMHPEKRADALAMARACLAAALHTTPTPGPLDGQEPLIGETTWS